MKKRKHSQSNKQTARRRPASNKNALAIIAPRYGTITMTSWKPPEKKLTVVEWKEALTAVTPVTRNVAWVIGDMWAYGERRGYGERSKALEESGLALSLQTVMDYGWVARSVKASLRNEALSFQHHKVVAPLSPAQQRHWLDRAESEKLSAAAMQDLIAAAQSAQIDQHLSGSSEADGHIDDIDEVGAGDPGDTASEVHHDQPHPVLDVHQDDRPAPISEMTDDAKWRFNLKQGGNYLLHIPHAPLATYLHPDVHYTAEQWDEIAAFLKKLAAAMRNTVAALDEARNA
jgi:hypothetical protein